MGANSAIEWTDHTFNPWMGCTRVSEGCTNCYAEHMMDHRLGKVIWGPKGQRVRTSDNNWRQPLHWNARAARRGIRYRVFCASLADVFDNHPSIPEQWRDDLWQLIAETPNLDWLLLTKRPQNWAHFLPTIEPRLMFRSIRLGVTIENDEARDTRAHLLRMAWQLGWPTFISYEPALGPLDWSFLSELTDSWLIAGGESGPHARPPHPDWFRQARDAAASANTPFLFKQWGEWSDVPSETAPSAIIDITGQRVTQPASMDVVPTANQVQAMLATLKYEFMWRVGKHAAGRLLDGIEHNAFPPSSTPCVIPAQAGTHPPRVRAASESSEPVS